MRTPFVLLKYVAKALGNALGGGIAGDLIVDVLPEVAKEVWGWWSKDRATEQRRAEFEAVAQAGAEEVRQQAAEIVLELIADKPAEVRQAVEVYLTQVPAYIRRSLRRPSDPTGTTVPASLVPRNADDLLRLLPPKSSRFKPGSHPLSGVDWELEALLGVGGFGEVWKARNPHMSSQEPVALKFCLDPAAARVLRNEAGVLDRVMRQGRHPGIVQLLRTYLRAETPCLEYEYVDGGDLTGLIQEWHRDRGGPTPQQAAEVVLRLAEVVGFAHRLSPPIVHRDLKPANILVQRTAGGEAHFKVADFGIGGAAVGQAIREISRGASRGRFLTSALHGSCTPLYASPQQMRGEPPDPRDDVYSLGVIWYQLLTGNLGTGRPGGTRWQRRLNDQGVPTRHIEILASCFEEEAADRSSDAAALAEELALIGSAPGPVQQPSGGETTHPPNLIVKSAQEYLERAEAYRGKNEHDRPVADFTEAIRLHPKEARPYATRVESYRWRGEYERAFYDRAVADLTEAIRLDPKYACAYAVRGNVYRMKGEYGRAIADCDEAIRLDPKYALSYLTRGEAYWGKGEYDRAFTDCDFAIRLNPKLAGAYVIRGEAYRWRGEYDRAIADCDEAIRLNPEYAWAYATRGEAYRRKGDFDLAISNLTEALRLAPGHEWAKKQLEVAKQDLARTRREREQPIRPEADSGRKRAVCPCCQRKLRTVRHVRGSNCRVECSGGEGRVRGGNVVRGRGTCTV